MNKIKEFQELIAACNKRMNDLLTSADVEHRGLSVDEESEFNRLDKGITECRDMLEKLIKVQNDDIQLSQVTRTIPMPNVIVRPDADDKEFKNLGEFLYLLRFDPNHRKLCEHREQTFNVGAEGGLMVPSKFMPDILKVEPMAALFRPRAFVLPADEITPDADITLPVLDQSTNMYGGIQMYSMAEGQAPTESSATLKDLNLKPAAQGGHCVISDKLLRNWSAAGTWISGLIGGAKTYYEDTLFLSGNGVAKPTGFLNHGATIGVARTTANQIAYADVVGMYARTLMRGGNYAWITSQTTIPQLANIRDTGNNNLWIQSAVAGVPPTLMGIPVLFHERVPGLGSRGDLMLVNFNYYLIQDGSGPFLKISDQVYFLQGKTVFRMEWNIDGKPAINAPIPLEGSTSDTVSPFVVLAA